MGSESTLQQCAAVGSGLLADLHHVPSFHLLSIPTLHAAANMHGTSLLVSPTGCLLVKPMLLNNGKAASKACSIRRHRCSVHARPRIAGRSCEQIAPAAYINTIWVNIGSNQTRLLLVISSRRLVVDCAEGGSVSCIPAHQPQPADVSDALATMQNVWMQGVGSCPYRRLMRRRLSTPPEEQLPPGVLGHRCASLHDCDSSGAVVNVRHPDRNTASIIDMTCLPVRALTGSRSSYHGLAYSRVGTCAVHLQPPFSSALR